MLTVRTTTSFTFARKNTLGPACIHIADTKKSLMRDCSSFSDLAAQILHLSACAFAGLGCRRGVFIFHEDRNQRIGVMFPQKLLRPHRRCVGVRSRKSARYFRNSQITTATTPDTAKTVNPAEATYPKMLSIEQFQPHNTLEGTEPANVHGYHIQNEPGTTATLYQSVSAAAC